MKKKLWLLLLLALMLLMPAGRAQAENLLISPAPGAISDKPRTFFPKKRKPSSGRRSANSLPAETQISWWSRMPLLTG